MKTTRNQSGMAALEGLLILILLALIGFVGYKISNARSTSDKLYKQSTSEQSQAANATVTPEINSASDLTKAEEALNQINPDDSNSDATQLNSQLSAL